jgi:nucleoside-diphosphate-sugar epimerase
MRVLLFGSGGFIGLATQSALISEEHQVFGLSRRTNAINNEKCISLIGNREDTENVVSLVNELQIDCVIDFKAMCLETTRSLINALSTVEARYVMISSSDVYRNYGLLNKLDSGPADASPLVETSPLRGVLFPYRSDENANPNSPDHWKYTYDKIPIQAYLAANHRNWSILRLPMVYGPGDEGLLLVCGVGQRRLSPIKLNGAGFRRWNSSNVQIHNILPYICRTDCMIDMATLKAHSNSQKMRSNAASRRSGTHFMAVIAPLMCHLWRGS